jgi:hypothetical protein
MYLDLYDGMHRAVKVTSNPDAGEPYMQKGEREFLLCETCEGHLSLFEDYAAPIVKSLLSLTAENTPDAYVVRDVQYQRFKLFQMSVLWRASVASIKMFQHISLGPHEEQLRTMILAGDPGRPDEYGCLMLVMEKTKYLHRIIWSPVTDTIDGQTIYRFQTGRLFWYYFLVDPNLSDVAPYFLDPLGVLRVPKAPWPEEVVIQRLAGRIAEARKRRVARA